MICVAHSSNEDRKHSRALLLNYSGNGGYSVIILIRSVHSHSSGRKCFSLPAADEVEKLKNAKHRHGRRHTDPSRRLLSSRMSSSSTSTFITHSFREHLIMFP